MLWGSWKTFVSLFCVPLLHQKPIIVVSVKKMVLHVGQVSKRQEVVIIDTFDGVVVE